MICAPPSYSELNVWKNSSWIRSLPSKNWMSSTRSTSKLRYRRLKPSIRLSRSESMKSFMNVSLVT